MNYRDEAPNNFSEVTSDGIISFFEDERTTEEEINWFREVLTAEENQLKTNPISKYNWSRIKKEFCKKYFPDLAPKDTSNKKSTAERLNSLLGI